MLLAMFGDLTLSVVGDMAFNGMVGTVGCFFALGGIAWANRREVAGHLVTAFVLCFFLTAIVHMVFGLGQASPQIRFGACFLFGFLSRSLITWARGGGLLAVFVSKATGATLPPEVVSSALEVTTTTTTTTTLPPRP